MKIKILILLNIILNIGFLYSCEGIAGLSQSTSEQRNAIAVEEQTCNICYEQSSLLKPFIQLACSTKETAHLFHTGCILQWEKQQNSPKNCPMCRTQLSMRDIRNAKQLEKEAQQYLTIQLLRKKPTMFFQHRDDQGNSLLHMAAREGEHIIVKFLIEANVIDVNTLNNKQQTPLHLAVVEKKPENYTIVQMFINAHANLIAKDFQGNTPLHYVTLMRGSLVSAKLLIDANPLVVNQQNLQGYTPLYLAAAAKNQDIVAALLDAHADVMLIGENKETAWHIAFKRGYAAIEQLLRPLNPIFEKIARQQASHQLLKIAQNKIDNLEEEKRSIDSILPLLEEGADPYFLDKDGLNTLHKLAIAGHGGIFNAFKDTPNADFNVQDTCGNTPLHHAVTHKQDYTVLTLLQLGANAESKNSVGNTALHLAAKHGFTQILEILLNKTFIDPDLRNDSNQTALHFAVLHNQVACIKLLLEYRADPQLTDAAGLSPLLLAKRLGHKNTEAALQEALRNNNPSPVSVTFISKIKPTPLKAKRSMPRQELSLQEKQRLDRIKNRQRYLNDSMKQTTKSYHKDTISSLAARLQRTTL
ncbi:hypothetical protein FJ364_02665 [Candidatus Dependentiae bacterium]|nr:hypothetical protein [Candidatus Dependentiae bacterium]